MFISFKKNKFISAFVRFESSANSLQNALVISQEFKLFIYLCFRVRGFHNFLCKKRVVAILVCLKSLLCCSPIVQGCVCLPFFFTLNVQFLQVFCRDTGSLIFFTYLNMYLCTCFLLYLIKSVCGVSFLMILHVFHFSLIFVLWLLLSSVSLP